MTILTEKTHTGEFLISEATGTRSRDKIMLVSGAGALRAGQLLGKITASGKYGVYAPAAGDGRQVAVAILYSAADSTGADTPAVAVTRDAEVDASLLTSLDAAARIALAAVGIIVR